MAHPDGHVSPTWCGYRSSYQYQFDFLTQSPTSSGPITTGDLVNSASTLVRDRPASGRTKRRRELWTKVRRPLRARRTGRPFTVWRSPGLGLPLTSKFRQRPSSQGVWARGRINDDRCGLVARGRPLQKLVGSLVLWISCGDEWPAAAQFSQQNNTNNDSGGPKCRRTPETFEKVET
jgi:hypothetical protein